MPDFSPPFADDAELRQPTDSERQNGFPCGGADRALVNGLINLIEGQFKHLGDQAGVAPAGPQDHTYNYRAIAALIAAATGGGDTEDYVLMSQARTRLPIFPEVLSDDGRINIYSPATGTVRVPGSVDLLHRGIFIDSTAETDFQTDSSKTYHLRWNSTDGLSLQDLASSIYNAGTLPEADSHFDSAYDDALLARVVTNSSNVATITNLANKHRLYADYEKTTVETDPSSWDYLPGLTGTVGWARTPKASIISAIGEVTIGSDSLTHVVADADRYVVSGAAYGYGFIDTNSIYQSGKIKIGVTA